ncbi:DEKNAAC102255 [Brettanomyces naardenensis]|uniref:DEKNAAC102255 n=1 Tax=Brettanomyces naardenensis TaxID=13370 RepID=A0A448YKX9_BRENA|nr:DEKNAAC102255 [Brettanomyces naardenensis]
MASAASPDEVVDSILEGLCVSPSSGVELSQIWELAKEKIPTIDEFYKKLIWAWLIQEKDFCIFKLSDDKKSRKGDGLEPIDKSEAGDYEKVCDFHGGIHQLRFKVNEDRQSIYLTGVPMKNNVLGAMPYELLNYIARAKEKGITSVDLTKESGQDKRSLTSRLQVLEEHGYIRKAPAVVSGFRTYVIIHYRFQHIMGDFDLRFEKYDMMQSIVNELQIAPNGVRVISDLMKQVNADKNKLDKRRFHGLIRALCAKGFAEEIVVVHEESSRKFVGVKLLKPLPPATGLSGIKEQLNDITLDDQESTEVSTTETTYDDNQVSPSNGILYNKVFPLPNQIYDLVSAQRGITAVDLETKMNGKYKTRVFSNALAGCSSEKPAKDRSHQIIRQLCYESKQRFFRLLLLPDYLKLNNIDAQSYLRVPPPPLDGNFEKSLIEEAAKDIIGSSKLRCRLFSVGPNISYFYWNSYKGGILSKHVKPQKSVTSFSSIDGHLVLKLSKSRVDVKKKTLINSHDEKDEGLIKAQSESTLVSGSAAELNPKLQQEAADDMEQLIKDIYGEDPEKVLRDIHEPKPAPVSSSLFIDRGPRARRMMLLQMVDQEQFCILNGNLCDKLSAALKVDYLIDRRTLTKDAVYLESKGKIKIERRNVSNKRSHTLLISISNPLAEEKFEDLFANPTNSQSNKVKKETPTSTISFSKVKFFKLPDASALAVKKKRAPREKEALGSRRLDKPVGKYSLRLMFEKKQEKADQEEEEEEGAGEEEEEEEEQEEEEGSSDIDKVRHGGRKRPLDDDLLAPLMKQKKRKKITAKSKQTTSATHPGMKKKRTNSKLEKKYTMSYIRGVIVSQSLSTGQNIEWPKVAELFDKKYTAEMLRRQWPKHRKLLGYRGLQQARKNWENVLMNSILTERITEEDLLNYDLSRLINIWQDDDPDLITNKASFVLYNDYEANLTDVTFKVYQHATGGDMFKDALSLIDKEIHYANALFAYPVNDPEVRKALESAENPADLERAKSKLKALFATGPKEFSSERAKAVFSQTSNEVYAKALSELEDEKAIAFLGEDSSIKFALTDKLLSIADCKMDEKFFENASKFYDSIDQASGLDKGVILSKRAPDGCYAVLLNLIAEGKVKLSRVDQKPPSLSSYSTKSQDRRKLESDFIISDLYQGPLDKLVSVPPPAGPPCSTIWMDLNGNFNGSLWLKSVCLLVRCVVFRPGARLVSLCDRMGPFLESFEVKIIMDWLVARNIVREGPYGGYWIQPSWYLALHS